MTVHDTPPDDRPPRIAKSTTVGGAALAVLLAVYAFAQPVLNERLGWQLPGMEQFIQDGDAAVAEKAERISAVKPAEAMSGTPVKPSADASLLYGILADQGKERFLSPAGLLYGPGSQEGHRLKHVERHTVDDPGRPGSHGVFDGGMAGALVTIDNAYRIAKTGSQTSKQEADGRTIFTVDMGSRVGYVGGSDGRRRKNPLARRVRLVLERNRVITAYPL